MEYRGNALRFEDYCSLRECVGWMFFSEEQMQKALHCSLYTMIAIDGTQLAGIGRYYLIADGAVKPA